MLLDPNIKLDSAMGVMPKFSVKSFKGKWCVFDNYRKEYFPIGGGFESKKEAELYCAEMMERHEAKKNAENN